MDKRNSMKSPSWDKTSISWAIFLSISAIVILYFILLQVIYVARQHVGLREALGIALFLVSFGIGAFSMVFPELLQDVLFRADSVGTGLHILRWKVTVKTLARAGAMLLAGLAAWFAGLVVTGVIFATGCAFLAVHFYKSLDRPKYKLMWETEATCMFLVLVAMAWSGFVGLFTDDSLYISISALICGFCGAFQLARIKQSSTAGAKISREQFSNATLWMRLYLGAWCAIPIVAFLLLNAREADRGFVPILEKSSENIVALLLGGAFVYTLGPGRASYMAILKDPVDNSRRRPRPSFSEPRVRLSKVRHLKHQEVRSGRSGRARV